MKRQLIDFSIKKTTQIENRFFQSAAIFLLLSGGVIIYWGMRIFETPLAPVTVATIHLFVLGVITMTLFGSAYHLLPRWTQCQIPWPSLIPWTLSSLIIGAVTVFLGIGTPIHPWTLLIASAGVGFGFGFFLLQSLIMVIKTAEKGPFIALLRLCIVALTMVFFLGATFLGEYAHGFLPYDRFAMVGTHLSYGLFGWAGILIMLIRLHGTNCVEPSKRARWLSWGWMGSLITLITIPAFLFLLPNEPYWLWISMISGGGTLVLLTATAQRENLNNPYWRMGDLLGVCALIVLLLWPLFPDDRLRFLFGLLLLPGWCLSSLLGTYTHKHPMRLGRMHLLSHSASIVLPIWALLTAWEIPLQMGGVMMIFSATLFARSLTPPVTP